MRQVIPPSLRFHTALACFTLTQSGSAPQTKLSAELVEFPGGKDALRERRAPVAIHQVFCTWRGFGSIGFYHLTPVASCNHRAIGNALTFGKLIVGELRTITAGRQRAPERLGLRLLNIVFPIASRLAAMHARTATIFALDVGFKDGRALFKIERQGVRVDLAFGVVAAKPEDTPLDRQVFGLGGDPLICFLVL